MQTPDERLRAEHRKRDATSLLILGLFFSVLSLLVMAGIAWTWGNPRATVVNLGCGGVLLAVGVGMLYAARQMQK